MTIKIGKSKAFKDMEHKWERVKALTGTCEDDRKNYITPYPNETKQALNYRSIVFNRGFNNPAHELLSAPGNTIYRLTVQEMAKGQNSSLLEGYMQNCTMGDSSSKTLIQWNREIALKSLLAYGSAYILMDKPRFDVSEYPDIESQSGMRLWPYNSLIHPLQMLHIETDKGEVMWFAFKDTIQEPWIDPTKDMPKPEEVVKIYTNNEYIVVDSTGTVKKNDPNPFGFVPLIIETLYDTNIDYIGNTSFFDTANMIFMANNHLSGSNTEIWKHLSAIRLIPEAGLNNVTTEVKSDGKGVGVKMTADGDVICPVAPNGDKMIPIEYLTKELESIEWSEKGCDKYLQSAIDNERSAKSVAKEGYSGTTLAESGLAKLIEEEPVYARINTVASRAKQMHKNMLNMACDMIEKCDNELEYPDNYERQYFEELLNKIIKSQKVRIQSETYDKEMQKRIVGNIVSERELLNKIEKEIDSAPAKEYITDEYLESVNADADENE